MKPIAHIHTDLPPEFALDTAVEGLDEFSHLWLLWEFQNGTPGGAAADIAADLATKDKRGSASSLREARSVPIL